MTTLFYKALILQGEIWCWSLLGLKGLNIADQSKNKKTKQASVITFSNHKISRSDKNRIKSWTKLKSSLKTLKRFSTIHFKYGLQVDQLIMSDCWCRLIDTLNGRYKYYNSPFSFLSLATNFLGARTPTFFFCEAMLPKRSAKHVKRDSFLLDSGLYARTLSRNGRQKNNACSTELQ